MSTPEERIAARIRAARKRTPPTKTEIAARAKAGAANPEHTGLTQAEAAERIGRISMRRYQGWENLGTLGFMSRLSDIAVALETTESDLLGGENPLAEVSSIKELDAKLDHILDRLEELERSLF